MGPRKSLPAEAHVPPVAETRSAVSSAKRRASVGVSLRKSVAPLPTGRRRASVGVSGALSQIGSSGDDSNITVRRAGNQTPTAVSRSNSPTRAPRDAATPLPTPGGPKSKYASTTSAAFAARRQTLTSATPKSVHKPAHHVTARSFTDVARSEEALVGQKLALENELIFLQETHAQKQQEAEARMAELAEEAARKAAEMEAMAARAAEVEQVTAQLAAQLKQQTQERQMLSQALEAVGVDPISLAPMQGSAPTNVKVAVNLAEAQALKVECATKLNQLHTVAMRRVQASSVLLKKMQDVITARKPMKMRIAAVIQAPVAVSVV